MRLFSSAGLSFINRKVVVYISTWREAKFGEEDMSPARPSDKVRGDEFHQLA